MRIAVRDNNLDQAMRLLKKRMQKDGLFREMKLRRYFEKPSEKKVREKAERERRHRRLKKKMTDREA